MLSRQDWVEVRGAAVRLRAPKARSPRAGGLEALPQKIENFEKLMPEKRFPSISGAF